MRKKLIIITVFILLLISISLYYTYAIDITIEEVTSSNADLTFNINIEENSSRTINVKAGETKYFDVFVTNANDGTINYSLVYDNIEVEGITIAQVNTSKNKVSELIDANTTHQINMVIINGTKQDYECNISPVVGYENGGDLIIPNNYTVINDVYTIPKYLDNSSANPPKLTEGLIPVTYYNNTWVKADTDNKNGTYKWYDYDNKQWANAVLVSSSYRDSNNNDVFSVGEEIPNDAILAYYVWIPRYKYKVFNINKQIGVDSYNAKDTGIDIIFEEGKETTGTITCEYDFSVTNGSLSETCTGTNGEYYTHPAFTFGNIQLTGIWVGKYEISSTTSGDGKENLVSEIRIKENLTPLTYNQITTFSKGIQSMNATNNEYGLNSEKNDSHMIKNMEWGAIAYFINSKYGNCTNSVCKEIGMNAYYDETLENGYKTGCGPLNATSAGKSSVCNEYNSELGKLASGTGNVYGIYDFSGGTYEYVMANASSVSGSYKYSSISGGSNFTYSTDTAKYIDVYAYGTTYNDQNAYNRSRLGDATGEVATNSLGGSWYDDYGYFTYSTNTWFRRSGHSLSGLETGIFNYRRNTGDSTSYNSARAVLVVD